MYVHVFQHFFTVCLSGVVVSVLIPHLDAAGLSLARGAPVPKLRNVYLVHLKLEEKRWSGVMLNTAPSSVRSSKIWTLTPYF